MSFEVSKNILHYYTDLLRLEGGEQRTAEREQLCVTALQNVIRSMCQSRRNRLCGEDFTRLDFGNIALNGIYFSLDGEYPSRFDGSRLNEWNFIGGHRAGISAVAWSPDGRYILTSSYDNTAILWDADSGLMVRKLTGHTKGVTSAAFSPDGERIITGSTDCTPIIWETSSGALIKRLKGHSAYVNSVIALPDGSCLTLDINGTLIKWDMYSGECRDTSPHDNNVYYDNILSPCGKYFVGRSSFDVKLYQADTREILKQVYHDEEAFITLACFSADSKYLIAGYFNSVTVIWDIRKRKTAATLTPSESCGSVSAAVISPDGDTVFTGYSSGVGKVWSISGGLLEELTGHDGRIAAAAFSPDGKYLCTGSNDCCAAVWDTDKWKIRNILRGYKAALSSPMLSDNGRYCLTGLGTESVKIWDIENGRLARVIDGHGEKIISVPSYPEGRYYLTKTLESKNIRDIKTGECVSTFEFLNNFADVSAFLPDGKHFMTDTDNGEAGIFDIITKECMKTGKFMTYYGYRKIVFHPSGRYFICRYRSGSIYIWKLLNGNYIKAANSFERNIRSVAFSSDGNYFTTVSGKDSVSVWKSENAEFIVNYKFSDILYAQLIGSCLYGVTNSKLSSGQFSVFRVDVTDFYDIGEPETLATFYNADRLHIKNCSFKNITADDTARDIIYQYDGDTEKPISKSSAP